MASKAFDSTNNIDVRKFCIDLMPEINQTFTILFPFCCSCSLGELLAPQSPGREWDPLESLVFYSYWIWSHWKLQGINFTVKKKKIFLQENVKIQVIIAFEMDIFTEIFGFVSLANCFGYSRLMAEVGSQVSQPRLSPNATQAPSIFLLFK